MLCFVTAFDSEARPLIDYFRLKRLPDSAFTCYSSAYSGEDVFLIVSGLGKTNAAAATAYLHARSGFMRHAIWLNVGICGHAELQVGETRLAHKVSDSATNKLWYPVIATSVPWQTEALITVDQAAENYPHNALIDMEASGFLETALRFSSAELVHAIKIVSDNTEHPAQIPKPATVHTWIKPQLEYLDDFIASLTRLTQVFVFEGSIKKMTELIISHTHFTATQKNQLNDLLRRWIALNPDTQLPDNILGCSNAKSMLQQTQQLLEMHVLELT